MNWRRAMNQSLGFIKSRFTPSDYPDRAVAQRDFTLELGQEHIEAMERLDDLDAERRSTFTEQWKASERSRIQRDANAAVSRELYPARQVEVHEPYLKELRELADDTNQRFLLNPDFQAARIMMETKISQRREEVERIFTETERELNERFGITEHETQPRKWELVDAFLSKIQDQKSRQREDGHDFDR